ncbi:MAG: flagellin lysine-N-methylase [Selenomonadaceae bacterium]|nr:flagellin lysine-N-methylase [Selenomonadaceae bacterium]
MKCIRPKYMNDFKCDGTACGSRCCKGWRVMVDGKTYNKYSHINNNADREDILSKLLKSDDDRFFVKMNDDLSCPFLDADYLCKIQKRHGEDYLTDICHSYPRVTYKIGDIFEQSLTLTCPVAARLILLSTEPIEFEEVEVDDIRGTFNWTDKINQSVKSSIELQMSAIAILQNKNLALDERLIKLCSLLRDETEANDLNLNFDSVEHAKMMTEIFSKMYNANMNEHKKSELQTIYMSYHKTILARLMEYYTHIFENYLVNEFFMRCYPFAFGGGVWKNCKIFITGFKAMEFAIILTAISKNGFVSADEFLNMIDAINEKLDHNRGGMQTIIDTV